MSQEIVEVQFKGERKEFFVNKYSLPIKIGDHVIVEVDRGEDLGRVIQKGALTDRKRTSSDDQLSMIKRVATREELEQMLKMRGKEGEALKICHSKIEERGLKMKLIDVEWQYDGNKVSFFFTAEKRVDFRQLVKDLAAIFKTRIELKQIGVRDEARRIGGCGRCGYKLCCTTFLNEFEPVTLRAAKDQRLSLNPSQISGSCGRLMCCLMFERVFYKDQLKRFPKEGREVLTVGGQKERVVGLDILKEQVELKNSEGFRKKLSLKAFNELTATGSEKENDSSGSEAGEDNSGD